MINKIFIKYPLGNNHYSVSNSEITHVIASLYYFTKDKRIW